MIERPLEKSGLTRLMALFPVTTILGPRQSGKSTLAQEFAADHVFDLENPRDMALLAQPQLALEWAAEIKYADAPRLTLSMSSALQDLELEHLWILYPGDRAYPLAAKITTLPIGALGATWPYL